MNILNLYASLNGQTEKIAKVIEEACAQTGDSVITYNVREDKKELDLFLYDIIFIGSGVYTWLPGKHMINWITRQLDFARNNGMILPNAPRIPGKFACVYCTYAGPHTGEAEAIPAIKYMGQLFDHMGISIFDEWSIPAAFVPPKMQSMNTGGRLGNITGRPDANDLENIAERTKGVIETLRPAITTARQVA